jgi:hypothetical protein
MHNTQFKFLDTANSNYEMTGFFAFLQRAKSIIFSFLLVLIQKKRIIMVDIIQVSLLFKIDLSIHNLLFLWLPNHESNGIFLSKTSSIMAPLSELQSYVFCKKLWKKLTLIVHSQNILVTFQHNFKGTGILQ